MAVSKRFKLNRADIVKLLKGSGIAAAGAVLAIVADRMEWIEWSSQPAWGPVLGAALAAAVNALRKFVGEVR